MSLAYQAFHDARRRAIELTDRYRAVRTVDDAEGARLWDAMCEQMETARQLLQAWLDSDEQVGPV